MDKDFKKSLTKGTLLFVIKKEPRKEFIVELLEDVGHYLDYCPLRYLYRNKTHVSLIGEMKGLCFLPNRNDLYETYIITEEY